MAKRTFTQGRWRWALVGLAAVLVVAALAGGGFLYLRARDHATPLSADTALERFRADASGDSPPPATTDPRPAEGVYVYATTGGEEVDALGGARHDYPSETTVTIRHQRCGVLFRWHALVERWDERLTCPAEAGDEVRTFSSRHEFFGQADQKNLVFEPGNLTCPAPIPGTTWRFRGTGSDTSVRGTGAVVALPTVRVDGQDVATVRIRVVVHTQGSARGTSRRDSWVRMTDCLLVREVAHSDNVADSPLGDVHYTEDYELHLQTLEPQA